VVSFSIRSLGRASAGLALAGLAATPIAASLTLTGTSLLVAQPARANSNEILLVSYAVTKAAYDKIIPLFVADYKKKTGETVRFKSSYGGSGSQTRAVIDGLEADVVGLALAADVYKLQDKGLVDLGWERELPNQSIITNSTVVLFVRPGNPKKIQSWNDLDNKNVDVITANPKTSGGARWNFAALWGSAGGDEQKAKNFITTVYRNVDVLPKDAREATDTFVKRRKGDVLLNYENEAILARKTGEWTEPVKIPSPNILIEGPIAVVDKNVNKHGTRKVAEAYAQGKFPAVNTWRITKLGGWKVVDKKFFSKGAMWDQIFAKSR
jgi:sulfate transport system substrate-binding protein